MAAKTSAIICTECGEDTLVKRESQYDGFKIVGEIFSCISCGHTYESEDDVPYKDSRSTVFSEADKSPLLDIFKDAEKATNCRHCKHYVVNPFKQRCDLQDKEVDATDLCDEFERSEENEED